MGVLEDTGRPNWSSAHVDWGERFTPIQGIGTKEKMTVPAVSILTVFPNSYTSSYVTWFGSVPVGEVHGALYPPLPSSPSPWVCNCVFLMVCIQEQNMLGPRRASPSLILQLCPGQAGRHDNQEASCGDFAFSSLIYFFTSTVFLHKGENSLPFICSSS